MRNVKNCLLTVDERDADAVAPPEARVARLATLVVVSPRDTSSTMTSAPCRLFTSVSVFSYLGLERVFTRSCSDSRRAFSCSSTAPLGTSLVKTKTLSGSAPTFEAAAAISARDNRAALMAVLAFRRASPSCGRLDAVDHEKDVPAVAIRAVDIRAPGAGR